MTRLLRALRRLHRARHAHGGRVTPRQPDPGERPVMLSPGAPQRRVENAVPHLGEPADHWCPRCLTSCATRVPVHLLVSTGPRTIGEYTVCTQCGWSPYDTPETQ